MSLNCVLFILVLHAPACMAFLSVNSCGADSYKSSRGSREHRSSASTFSAVLDNGGTNRHNQPSTVLYFSHTAPALDSADGNGPGAPPLPVLCTNDSKIMERWLNENVSGNCILGFDTESVAKADWFPDRQHLPDGPACIQLSTVDSALVVHLARCGDGTAKNAPEVLRQVLNDPFVIKAGVGLDDDALEVYRWGKANTQSQQGQGQGQGRPTNWEIRSRFDLGAVAGGSARQRMGLRRVAAIVANVDLPKSRKLAMSNWGARKLNSQQVAYAGRDAWAAAKVMDVLRETREDVFGPDALLESTLEGERGLEDMDTRARQRRAAKLELKAMADQEKNGSGDFEPRIPKDELWRIMDELRPDPPPLFDSKDLSLPW